MKVANPFYLSVSMGTVLALTPSWRSHLPDGFWLPNADPIAEKPFLERLEERGFNRSRFHAVPLHACRNAGEPR
jgi:hypothetical protein